ncbi:hypothetical protein EZV62_001597 [Acer yangbiense]|uniref:NusB/RsmB/TIM44 domain-containing protein n=1 Tax=Acer yangbiense TaxID=1000413 RepID=A0A5C7IVB0_9ROSI|nr:hypothetical protein EZV62_001597 [Acer yangbiense]
MEANSVLSCYSKTHFTLNLQLSSPPSTLYKHLVSFTPRTTTSHRVSCTTRSSLAVQEALESVSVATTSMPKIDKSGRFCSPRAARELALLILYASCLEGSDPIRLFEKRVNSSREPGYGFDKASLLEYNHMSFGGPPVTTETVEEADELLRNDEKESAIGNQAFEINFIKPPLFFSMINCIILFVRKVHRIWDDLFLLESYCRSIQNLQANADYISQLNCSFYKPKNICCIFCIAEAEILSAPPKLVYSKLLLRFTRKLLVAVVEKWDSHARVIDKVVPPNWKDQPSGRILELSILHLAMSEITVIGTRHQIVINEAVDLAKRFCDGAAPRIINGCLRTFVKDLEGAHTAESKKQVSVEVL